MMTRGCRNLEALLRLALPLVWLLAAWPVVAFDAIYAFGDSLTDTGNNPAPGTNYFQGRYSNGPLWIEYLSTQLGLAYDPANNHAQSGGETSDGLAQVRQFTAPGNSSRSLFVVWAGGNDFIHNFYKGVDDAYWNSLIALSVANLSNAVSVLYADGARVIVVPNQVDLSRIPLVLDSGLPFLPQLQVYLRGKLEQFNGSLGAALTAIEQANPDLELITPDVYARFNDLLANLINNGFSKADPDALTDAQLIDKSFTGPGKDYVFWDSIHPTTKAHALVAQWFCQALPAASSQPELDIGVSGGALQLTLINLRPGQIYTLQSSTNLAGWTDVTAFSATNSVGRWTLSLGSSSHGFFRLKR